MYRSENPTIAKLQYGMKIAFIFILILFIDSVNRVYRVQLELAETNRQQGYVSYLVTELVTHSIEGPPSWATSV